MLGLAVVVGGGGGKRTFTTEEVRGARGATEASLDDEASEAVHQATGVEVQQQADANAAHAKVGQQLRFVCRDDCGHGFDFDNDSVVHNDVGTKALLHQH